jgi:N-acetylneuraminic acid mutarotase
MNLLIVFLMGSVLTQQISWTTKTPLPQQRAGAACAVVNDSVYVIGGRGSSSVQYKTTYVYDPIGDSWTTKADMPTARGHISAAIVNGIIYVFGGWVGSTASNAVEAYNPVSDTWEIKTPMATARYAYCCGVVNDRIYVIGGMDMQGNIFNTVEGYDPSADTIGGTPWQTRASMPTQRMGPACAVINDSIFVFGGSTAIGGGVTTVHQCYDPVSDSWTSKTSMFQARYALGGLAYENRAYAIGGYDYYNYRTEVEVFTPLLNSWSYETPIQYARQSVAVGLVGNKIYVIGGWNNGALDYNEEGTLPVGTEEVEDRIHRTGIKLTASPNPFRDGVEIRLQCESEDRDIGETEIQIYDVGGRKVREISLLPSCPVRESFSNGVSFSLGAKATWDGRDNNGKLLPGGSYIVRVKGEQYEESKLITIIR